MQQPKPASKQESIQKAMQASSQSQVAVCALYKFVALPHFEDVRQPLLDIMEQNEIKGTLLLR